MSIDNNRSRALAAVPALLLAACASSSAIGESQQAAPVAPAAVAAPAPTRAPARPLQAAAPTTAEMSAGIQVMHVGVTGGGGLVDVRFRVLDSAKVAALMADMANAPQLVVGDKPPLVAPHHAIKGGRYAKDQTLFVMYPNMRKAVEPGVDVFVAFGATRLGPVRAQ